MWNGAASFASPTTFFVGLAFVVFISVVRLRDELKKAIELDRQAFQNGYYEQKKVYLDFMFKQFNDRSDQ